VLLGVDVGGTFTDAVLLDGARIHTAKSPTTPADQSEGVLAAVEAVLARAGASATEVTRFAHGMTVGTNALLERRGARTALVATEGFTDVLEIARQDRPSLYRLDRERPSPLSPPELRVAVRERIDPGGVVTELTDAEVDRVVAEIARLGPEAVAICLLHSYLDPAHEQRLADAIRAAQPGVHVSVSSEVLPRFREYERCSTTVLDAYLSPLLGGYLSRLGERCADAGLPEPLVMRSSGGVVEAAAASRTGAWSVLSGPAGGAVGAAIVASSAAGGNAIGLDMGGTSCDVCVVTDGTVGRTDGRELEGRPIQLPMVDVHTVGAGGGSIAWRDGGGALRVGPRSAGAEPGPACYGRGGTDPTVTDANLLLGYLDSARGLAGGVELDHDAATAAVADLAGSLGLGTIETAEGIVEVANQEMIRALRVVTVERGIDPRDLSLLPFGGAGALHAAAIAEELGIDRIACPLAGGVLSALGLVRSERRRDITRTVMLAEDRLTSGSIATEIAATVALLDPPERATIDIVYGLRYRGQSFELQIPGPRKPDPDELAEAFAVEHERRYGYRDPSAPVELVDIGVAAREPAGDAGLGIAPAAAFELARREVRFAAGWVETSVFTGRPGAGTPIGGPALIEADETTLVLPPAWQAEVDEHGTIVAERRDRRGAR
jgi:N-methylhydantoinase A